MEKLCKLSIVLFVLSVLSCQKSDPESFVQPKPADEVADSMEGILSRAAVIGEAEPNPYEVSNMRRALREYNALTKSDLPERVIAPTHHYIVFKPSCHAHYRSLIMRDDISTDPYPLDHKISDGWVMVDPNPEYSTNGYQHRWGYVPIDVDLSDVECPYEVLYDIVSLDDVETKSLRVSEAGLTELEALSYRLCGLPPPEPIGETKATSVTPHGNITYRDSTYNAYVGCNGMSVRAKRLAKETFGYCDESGNFTCDKSFKYKWTYTVYFDRHDFEMRRDTGTEQVMLVFSDRHDALNLQFNTSNQYIDCVFYCEILRAACRYFYLSIDGLNRPPMRSELSDRLYIQAVRGVCPDHAYMGLFQPYLSLDGFPYLQIYRNSHVDGRRYSSAEVYCTSIHELAHSAHWKQNPSYFCNSVSSKVKESFATGIAWHLTRQVHPYYHYSYHGDYTGIVEDLMDNDGYKYGSMITTEDVTGFTIKDIEDAVQGAATWDDWADNIVSLYPYNPTVGGVHDLFGLW